MTVLLNFVGLGIAFSIFLILMSQVWWDLRYDHFKGSRRVYIVESPSFREGFYGESILRPAIQTIEDCSQDIATACDYVGYKNDKNGIIQIKDQSGEYKALYGINYGDTESSALDVFNVAISVGRREDFAKEGDAIISESTARLYFPDRNPIGETFIYKWNKECRIVGIYKDRKENESLVNGFLIHEGETDNTLPNYNPHVCYIALARGARVDKVKEAVGKIDMGYIAKNLRITQIHDAWFERDRDYWGEKRGGNLWKTLLLAAIAILFLALAGSNYINFSLASIPFRIKDINTRKVFGASRNQLIIKQLASSASITAAALLLGILAMRTVSGTYLGTFLSWNMTPEKNIPVILIGTGAAAVVALAAGLIPAFYSTSFQPAVVLKGSFALSAKGGGLRNVTIALQYVLSFIFMICGMVLQRQSSFMVNNRELGFDYDRVLTLSSHLYTKTADVARLIADIPGVESVTRGESPMQSSLSSMSEIRDGNEDRTVQYSFRNIPPEYAEFFHLELAQGRLPSKGEEKVALVNESFHEAVPSFGIGSSITTWNGQFTIIGILKDFHAMSLENDYSPLALFVMDSINYSSFMIRIAPNADARQIIKRARNIYCSMKNIEEDQTEAGYLDKEIENLYEQDLRQTRLIRLSSILSLIITLIGIMGVVWLDSRFMRKEIAIRKVNGATRREILSHIGWKYLILAFVSFIVATPISYIIAHRYLEHFAFRTTIPAWIFIAALGAVLLVTLATVTLQSWRAANANPLNSLKNE